MTGACLFYQGITALKAGKDPKGSSVFRHLTYYSHWQTKELQLNATHTFNYNNVIYLFIF